MKTARWFLGIGVILFFIFGGVFGCATQPMTTKEMFPVFNTDPRKGIVVIEGSQSALVTFRNQTGVVESWSELGSNPSLTYNGRGPVRIYLKTFEKGQYSVNVETFYYLTESLPPFRRHPIEGQKLQYGVTVTDNPKTCQDTTYTKAWWGWCLIIYTGEVPRDRFPYLQAPVVDITCTGILEAFCRRLQGR